MQSGSFDCGIFAIAFATALVFGRRQGDFFSQQNMRSHLIECLEHRSITLFPTARIRRSDARVKAREIVKVFFSLSLARAVRQHMDKV